MRRLSSSSARGVALSGPGRARVGDAVRLGIGLATGWILHDLFVFLPSGDPRAAADLVPGSLVAVAVAALLAWSFAVTRWLLPAVLLVSVVAALAPLLVDVPFSRAQIWLPRATFLLTLAWAAGAWSRRRWHLPPLPLGLFGGVLACVAKTLYRGQFHVLVPVLSLALLAGSALGLFAAMARPRPARLACGLVALIAPCAGLLHRTLATVGNPRPDLPPPAASGRTGANGTNLVLIVLDTVRADHLAPYGYGRVTTPGLDAFARDEATVHTQARSTSSWTLPSHASLFTGLLPAAHGSTHHGTRSAQPLRDDVRTLAERLREAGYRTGAIVANAYYLSPRYRIDRGFEHYDARPGSQVLSYLPLAQLTGRRIWVGHLGYRRAETVTDRALAWLDRRSGEPFFLALNYFDAHFPYLPPPPFDRAFGSERPVDPLNPKEDELRILLYDRELSYLDAHVTRLLDDLRARGLFERTTIIVTSDHGEALGERNLWDHGLTLYEEVLRVPLYVKPAGGRRERTSTRHITGAQVHDLMLRELGLEVGTADRGAEPTAEWYPGPHHREERLQRWAEEVGLDDLGETLLAWFEGGTKYVVSSGGAVEAYDLAADPEELRPLSLTPVEVEAALSRARAWWKAHATQAANTDIDERTRSRMRAVGYGG